MVIVWLFLVTKLYSLLKLNHPLIYIDWGSPYLFDGEAYAKRTHHMLVKFIVKREYKSLKDKKLSKLCDFMLAFGMLYILLLISLVVYSIMQELA